LLARLQPAVVNISTRQRIPVRTQTDPFEEFFRRFGAPDTTPQSPQGQQQGQQQQPRTREAGSLGSGFIISPDGYVVTNNHLIQGLTGTGTVDTVTVTLTNRKEYTARIVGRDTASDLALLKIDAANLPYVTRRSHRTRVGDCDRHRQPLWPRRHGHGRHRLGAAPRHHRCRRVRSLHPD
jgi:serine protease Do